MKPAEKLVRIHDSKPINGYRARWECGACGRASYYGPSYAFVDDAGRLVGAGRLFCSRRCANRWYRELSEPLTTWRFRQD